MNESKNTSSIYTVQEAKNGSSETTEKEELLEQHKVQDTPFTIVKYGEQWFLTMGKYRLTEPSKSREIIEQQINDVSWDRIMQVMMVTIEEMITPIKVQQEILLQHWKSPEKTPVQKPKQNK